MDYYTAQRIRKLREGLNLSQQQLADKLGVKSQQAIAFWETGGRSLKDENIIKIAKFFNVSADYLLGISSAPTKDADLQTICDYTGLNIEAVEKLHEIAENKILETYRQQMNAINKLIETSMGKISSHIAEYVHSVYKCCILQDEHPDIDFIEPIDKYRDDMYKAAAASGVGIGQAKQMVLAIEEDVDISELGMTKKELAEAYRDYLIKKHENAFAEAWDVYKAALDYNEANKDLNQALYLISNEISNFTEDYGADCASEDTEKIKRIYGAYNGAKMYGKVNAADKAIKELIDNIKKTKGADDNGNDKTAR